MSNYPTGYVIAGTKFFEPNNTDIYVTGFSDFSQHQFTVTHPTAVHSFTTLQTFWKSFTHTGTPGNPSGFFIAAAGTRMGVSHYYALLTDKAGKRKVDRFGPLDAGFQFGGACPAADGGYVVVGNTNQGKILAAEFSPAGELETTVVLPLDGFGWTVQPALGGGYVIGSTDRRATRVDNAFNVVWSIQVNLPPSPPPDGSAYTYTEFEEILPLQNTGVGFVMTGSAFSNQTSAVYTARLNWDGTVPWKKVNDAVNTSLPGTPVAWTNSAVETFSTTAGVWDILFTWRKGPVSAGGTLYAERMNPANGEELQKVSLLNTIPVQEAFTVRQHFVNRIVIAGVRGGYGAAYSYTTESLP